MGRSGHSANQYATKLDPRAAAALTAHAAALDRTVSWVMRRAIEQYLGLRLADPRVGRPPKAVPREEADRVA